jgi:hypothetical protein
MRHRDLAVVAALLLLAVVSLALLVRSWRRAGRQNSHESKIPGDK